MSLSHEPLIIAVLSVFNFFRVFILWFLCLLKELGISKIPYAGRSAIIGMSDFCIRDFLEIIAHIYDSFTENKQNKSVHSLVNI